MQGALHSAWYIGQVLYREIFYYRYELTRVTMLTFPTFNQKSKCNILVSLPIWFLGFVFLNTENTYGVPTIFPYIYRFSSFIVINMQPSPLIP